jgi:Cu/Ag efflux protein CusF
MFRWRRPCELASAHNERAGQSIEEPTMTTSKAYVILGLVIIGGLTVAGITASTPDARPVVAATADEPHGGDAKSGAPVEMATYTFNGFITAIDEAASKITIKHDKIEGYMDAMTMAYDVIDPSMLKGLKVGDQKGFVLHINPKMKAIVGIGEPEAQAPADAATPATKSDSTAACAEHKPGEKCAHEGQKGHDKCCARPDTKKTK